MTWFLLGALLTAWSGWRWNYCRAKRYEGYYHEAMDGWQNSINQYEALLHELREGRTS